MNIMIRVVVDVIGGCLVYCECEVRAGRYVRGVVSVYVMFVVVAGGVCGRASNASAATTPPSVPVTGEGHPRAHSIS